jgi:hypothetical protein
LAIIWLHLLLLYNGVTPSLFIGVIHIFLAMSWLHILLLYNGITPSLFIMMADPSVICFSRRGGEWLGRTRDTRRWRRRMQTISDVVKRTWNMPRSTSFSRHGVGREPKKTKEEIEEIKERKERGGC